MGIKQTINETENFTQRPSELWKATGVPVEIGEWLPAVEKAWMDGDVRVAELVGGAGQARERITEVNDEKYYYDYTYIDGPMVLKEFTSRYAIVPTEGGSRIEWTAEFQADTDEEGAQLTEAVSGMYRGGLDNLRAKFSGSAN